MALALETFGMNSQGQYAGSYPARPVWGYFASTNGTAPTSTNNFLVAFSARNPFVPMTVDFSQGSSQGNVGGLRSVSISEDSTGDYYSGNSTTQTTTEARAATSGYVGGIYLHQTGGYVGVEAFDNGHVYFGRRAGATNTNKQRSGIVIGERDWNQTYDLMAVNGKIYKRPIKSAFGSAAYTTPSNNTDFFFVSQAMYAGAAYNSPTGINRGIGVANPGITTAAATSGDATNRYQNHGMICHNRNTGKVAYLENTGTAGWRLHILDLRLKIAKATTIEEIFVAWNAAVAAGASRYNFYDITLPSWNNAYNTDFCSQQMKVILCNDDSMWIMGWDHTNAGSGTFRMYRNTTAGSYASWTQVSAIGQSTSYNTAAGAPYGISHFNSDDNTRVLVHVPYANYHSGFNGFCVNTQTSVPSGVGNEDVHWMALNNSASAGGYFAVPCGGNKFVTTYNYINTDGGTGAYFDIFDTSILRGQTLNAWQSLTPYFPAIAQSTAYHAYVPFKFLPTEEWKPDEEPWS